MVENSKDSRLFARESNVVVHKYATASFGLKMRIKIIGENREGVAVSSHRQLFQLVIEDEV